MPDFQERSRSLIVSPVEGRCYSATHDLSLVFDRHANREDARGIVATIPAGSFVGVEMCSHDTSKLNNKSLMPKNDLLDDPVKIGHSVLSSVLYNSIMFRAMLENKPQDYHDIRSVVDIAAASAEYGKEKGRLGQAESDRFGYQGELLFGLLEKGCLFVPLDADESKTTTKEAVRYVLGQYKPWTPEGVEHLDPNTLYETISRTAIRASDFHLMRDHAVVNQLVNQDDALYRQILGVGKEEKLPSVIVRGRAHSTALMNLLSDAEIEYKVIRDTTPAEEQKLGFDFGATMETEHMTQVGARKHLYRLLDRYGSPRAIEELNNALGFADPTTSHNELTQIIRNCAKKQNSFSMMYRAVWSAINIAGWSELLEEKRQRSPEEIVDFPPLM